MKRLLCFVILLMCSLLSYGQVTQGLLQGMNLPQSGVGQVTRCDTFKDKMLGGQFLWSTPVIVNYSSITGGSVSVGDVMTSGSGATGVCYYTNGSNKLWIRPTGGTWNQTNVTDTTSGATVVIATASAGQPINSVVLPASYVWGADTGHAYGIYAFNGSTVRRGGTTYSNQSTCAMYPTNCGILAATIGTQVVVTYSAKNGTAFVLGETETQSTTGGVGKLVGLTSTTLTIMVNASSAIWDTSHNYNVTGAGGGATTTVTGTTSGSGSFLEWSPDGWTNFIPLWSVSGSTGGIYLPHQACDVGQIAGSINGKTGTDIVMFGDYGEGNAGLYYWQPEVSLYTFNQLFVTSGSGVGSWPTSTQSIRHFHGFQWVPGKGAKEGRLYVMCGDADYQCGILTCDDIANLCNNGSTWKTRWGMAITGPARANWFSNATATQTTITYSGETLATTPGEPITFANGAVAYVVSDNGTNTLVVNQAGTPAALPSSGTCTGSNSGSVVTYTSISASTVTTGAAYVLGTNPMPTSTSSITGGQGIGGQDCRSIEFVVDNTAILTYSASTRTMSVGEQVRQSTSNAWGVITKIDTVNSKVYVKPDGASPAFGVYNFQTCDSISTVTVTACVTGKYAYFIPDQPQATSAANPPLPSNDGYNAPQGFNHLRVVDLETGLITTGGTRVIGTGWAGCLSQDGTVILTTDSEHTNGVTGYNGNSDGYLHVWAVNAATNTPYEIARYLRSDYAAPANTSAFFNRVFTAFGAIWGWDQNSALVDKDMCIRFTNKPELALDNNSNYLYNTGVQPKINWLDQSHWNLLNSTVPWNAVGNNSYFGVTSNLLDLDAGYNVFSMRFGASGTSGVGGIQQTIDRLASQNLSGGFATFYARVFLPSTMTGSFAVSLYGSGDNQTSYTTFPAGDDKWHTVAVTKYVQSETSLMATIYRLSGTDQTIIAVGEVGLVTGTQVPPRNTIGRDQLLPAYSNRLQISATVGSADLLLSTLAMRAKYITLAGATNSYNVNFNVVFGGNSQGFFTWFDPVWVQNSSGYSQTIRAKTGTSTYSTGFSLANGKGCFVTYNGTDMIQLTPAN